MNNLACLTPNLDLADLHVGSRSTSKVEDCCPGCDHGTLGQNASISQRYSEGQPRDLERNEKFVVVLSDVRLNCRIRRITDLVALLRSMSVKREEDVSTDGLENGRPRRLQRALAETRQDIFD